MPIFIEELRECVGDLQRNLQLLQKDPEQPVRKMLVDELYRAVHKIKGAANAAGVKPVEQLCRQMQLILIEVRDGQRSLDRHLQTKFAEAIRFLDDSDARLRDGRALDSATAIFEGP
jgi:two-component system chemotaxis sensor kinase CheA